MRAIFKAATITAVLVTGAGALTPAMAAPAGLAFQAVEPEGLDDAAMTMVSSIQSVMPAQMPTYEEAGYGAFGAIAVPLGQELKPDELVKWLVILANTDTADVAKANVIEACRTQTGAEDCTVIGLLIPASE
jgi:hypothetical protein